MARKPGRRKKQPAHVPHLGRQRGKREYWTGWLGGKEVALGTADATVAAERLHRMAQERQRAEANDSPTTSTSLATLAAKFVEFVQPPRRSPRTAESIQGRLLKFVEWAEGTGVELSSDVTSKVVHRYVDERVARGLSARTVNRDMTPVACMFRFGKKMGLISSNPLAGEEYRDLRLKEPTPAPNQRTLSPAQVDTFIKRMHEVGHPAYAALFAVIAGTGIRLDEACHLDLVDIDHANKLIRVTPKVGWTTKNYRFRSVPASEETMKAARNFVRLREQVSLERKAVWNQLQRVRKSIGLPPFSPHDLRRAWASAVHHRGASLKAISAWLGHGSLGVTERYVRVIDTDGHQFLPR